MTASELHHWVSQLHETSDLRSAIVMARKRLEKSPDDGHLWQLHGIASWGLKQVDDALEALEEANTLVALHPQAQFALACCYLRKKNFDTAVVIFLHLSKQANDTSLLAAVAKNLGALGADQHALETCRRITELDAQHHQAYFGIAYYLGRLNRPPENLIAPLARAMDLAPAVLHYRLNLAFAWYACARADQAYELLRSVAIEHVDCICSLRRMRAVFQSVGDHGLSLRCAVRLACLQQ